MSGLTTSMLTLGMLGLGGWVGSWLRYRLPDHHIRDDSKEVVQAASGVIATLVALVIGLLVSSSKGTFDLANDSITQAGARMILLDRTLARYGQDAMPIRLKMKAMLQLTIDRIWPPSGRPRPGLGAIEQGHGLDEMLAMIEALAPNDEARKNARAKALNLLDDLVQSRWLLIEKSLTELPSPFIVILIGWLTVLFTALGLLAPRNPTTITCLIVCAISMALALFLILEMNHPFDGLIQASPAPLQKAVAMIGT